MPAFLRRSRFLSPRIRRPNVGIDPFERARLAACFARLLLQDPASRRPWPATRLPTPLAGWLLREAAGLGLPRPAGIDAGRLVEIRPDRISLAEARALKATLEALQGCLVHAAPSALEQRLNWLSGATTLDDVEAELMGLLVRKAVDPLFQSLITAGHHAIGVRHLRDDEVHVDVLARLMGTQTARIAPFLRAGARLLRLQLVEDASGGDFIASDLTRRIAQLDSTEPAALQAALARPAGPSQLEWSDLDHLGPDRDLAEALLRAGAGQREVAVNLLFHGPPGTGKTEFAKLLAQRAGMTAFLIGERDSDDGSEPSRSCRIGQLMLMQELTSGNAGAVLVVDEADDLFGALERGSLFAGNASRVFAHRLIEARATPTIWITNHPDSLGQGVIRRMSQAIAFPVPPLRARKVLVRRLAATLDVDLDAGATEAMAGREVAPALLRTGLAMSRLAGGTPGREGVRIIDGLMTAMGEEPDEAGAPCEVAFDASLSHADLDLVMLGDRLAASGDRAWSMCLHGLPGTGKSAFARAIAARLGLDVLFRRASDLLDKYVGGSEKRIAALFRAGAQQGTIIILDEADSLLRDRAGAQHAWEVTQVNEMLTWMERHPLPVICTTNLMSSLDPATLRRFTFKVGFQPMRPEQAARAFRRFFAAEPPASVLRLEPLAPADFAVVQRRARLLGLDDPAQLAAMLAEEVAAKPGGLRGRIGFRAAG